MSHVSWVLREISFWAQVFFLIKRKLDLVFPSLSVTFLFALFYIFFYLCTPPLLNFKTFRAYNLFFFSETAYVSDTFNLYYKRSAQDRNESFFAYRIMKRKNITIIALGKEQDNENGSCVTDSVLLDECKQRFSLRYFNKTHLSFRIKNVTLQDAGHYLRQAFFLGMNDPEYAEISLFVQGNPFYKSMSQTI